MARITFIEVDHTRHEVDAPNGQTLMQAAVWHAVPGILAECGGSCACATCHVYIDSHWMGKLPQRSEIEASMLEGAISPDSRSRLACQITVSDQLDGLVVQLPERQI